MHNRRAPPLRELIVTVIHWSAPVIVSSSGTKAEKFRQNRGKSIDLEFFRITNNAYRS
jgi:hypothetical protein